MENFENQNCWKLLNGFNKIIIQIKFILPATARQISNLPGQFVFFTTNV